MPVHSAGAPRRCEGPPRAFVVARGPLRVLDVPVERRDHEVSPAAAAPRVHERVDVECRRDLVVSELDRGKDPGVGRVARVAAPVPEDGRQPGVEAPALPDVRVEGQDGRCGGAGRACGLDGETVVAPCVSKNSPPADRRRRVAAATMRGELRAKFVELGATSAPAQEVKSRVRWRLPQSERREPLPSTANPARTDARTPPRTRCCTGRCAASSRRS